MADPGSGCSSASVFQFFSKIIKQQRSRGLPRLGFRFPASGFTRSSVVKELPTNEIAETLDLGP